MSAAMGQIERSFDADDKEWAKSIIRSAIAEEAQAVKSAGWGKLKLDWTVNVAFVFFVLGLLLSGAWWMSQLSQRVNVGEQDIVHQGNDIKSLNVARVDADTRATKIEGAVHEILTIVQRIDVQGAKK